MRDLPHLAARLFDTPLMAHPAKARQIADVFLRQTGRRAAFDGPDDDGDVESGGRRRRRPMYEVIEGIAVIPVLGTLVHKSGNLHPVSGMTGYDGIAAKLRAARANPQVRAIWLDIHSPGGEVDGAFSLADEIHDGSGRRGGKPVWAIANDMAYSAAYLLASQADVVIAPRTAGLGSVGVIMMHADMTGALEDAGVRVTVIRAGERKARGNPYETLDEATYAQWLAECEIVRGMFADAVARARPIARDAVMATEGATFMAADALNAGLIDAVAGEIDGFAALLSEVRRAA